MSLDLDSLDQELDRNSPGNGSGAAWTRWPPEAFQILERAFERIANGKPTSRRAVVMALKKHLGVDATLSQLEICAAQKYNRRSWTKP